jgi:GTPase SAR1 family protein
MVLVGNKSDLSDKGEREVPIEHALDFKQKNNLLYFTETSAKSGDNVDRLFIDVAKFIYQKYKDKLHKLIDDETSSQNSRSNSFDGGRHNMGGGGTSLGSR